MLVHADAQALQDPITVERGIGRYVTELATSLEQAHPGVVNAWVLRAGGPLPPHATTLVQRGLFRLSDDPDLPVPDIWHVTSPFESLLAPVDAVWPRAVRGRRTKLVVTLYDLIPLLYQEQYLANPQVARAYRTRLDLVRHADRVLTISQATADDALRLLDLRPGRVDVVGTGVSEHFVPAKDPAATLAQALDGYPGLRAGFVMYTGGIDFRKNISGLLLAYSKLPSQLRNAHQLAIVCRVRDDERAQLEQQARALGVDQDVLLTGFVSDDQLLRMYQSTHLFVFPSLYEGFGLPVTEALASGAPALVGANSSLTELVQDPEAHFDAASADDIARTMFRALTDDGLRERLRHQARNSDHRWQVVAERTIDAYTAARAAIAPRSHLPRVALISPMPPAPSGVADYSMALLNELRTLADVDVFTTPDAHRPQMHGVTWYSYRELPAVERFRASYDGRIYAMGNSSHHVEIFRLLRRYGGTVLAHDVRFTGFAGYLSEHAPELLDDEVRQHLSDLYAGRRPTQHQDHVAIAPAEYYTVNGLLAGWALGDAHQILVHSELARMLARSDLPPQQRPQVEVVPFGHQVRTYPQWRNRDAVTSFGIVHTLMKRSALVCEAFCLLAPLHPELTFVLVGPADEDNRRRVEEIIDRTGQRGRVLVTGHVDDAEYTGWLGRSRLSVQLRAHSNGESSAAVADCLGAGVPVVATEVGSMASLGGVLRLVPPEIEPAALAAVIDEILLNPEEAARLERAGGEHARTHTFAIAARSILDAALAHR